MNSENIEIIGEEELTKRNEDVALPVNFVSVGDVDRDSLQIYLKQNVYKNIEKFAKEEMSKEVGSILVGDYFEDNGKNILVISDWIEAKYTDASASTLTFTHETWDYVYKEKDKNFPEKKIVGWQHTHPGYGIFLSNYDVFIQENFFNLPWQTAYVVDPIADTRGFFEWKGGKISKMTGFYVYDDIGKTVKISEKAKSGKKPLPLYGIVLSALLVISIVVSVLLGIENSRVSRELDKTIAKTDETDILLEKEEPVTEEGIRMFREYVVKQGDGLEAICNKFGIDYVKNLQMIMRINAIKNPNSIFAGQTIYLPAE